MYAFMYIINVSMSTNACTRCIRMHACLLYVCMYVAMYVCKCVCMFVCKYVCYVCMYACTCVCMYACTYVCMYVHVRMYGCDGLL